MALATVYDQVAYPSNLIKPTDPDRLALFGRLHGLDSAAPATARVLEIGCGDGYNLMGMAAAYPQATFEGFDLAETAIRAGQDKARAAGLDNLSLLVGDILTAKERIPAGSFDYFIAHGVYAWVPQVVSDAVLDLAEHVLAPHGVAYISYNAMPGGRFRSVMRDILLFEIEGIDDPHERLATVHRVLEEVAAQEPGNSSFKACLREMAEAMLEKNESVMFHDEIGEVYAPHFLSDVVANAVRRGLRYLAEAQGYAVRDGFASDGIDPDADPAEVDRLIVRKMQREDNRSIRFFHWSLFARAEAPIRRTLDLSILDDLWVSTDASYDEGRKAFVVGTDRQLQFGEEEITAAFARIVAAQPGRLPLRDILEKDAWRDVFVTLFANAYVDFHVGPGPYAIEVGDRPETNPFARFVIAQGGTQLPRLDHTNVRIDQPEMLALLRAANGERTIAEIAQEVDGVFPADQIEAALNGAARIALMRA